MLVTYMQMLSPPTAKEKFAPCENLTIAKLATLDALQYLSLYEEIGRPSRWPIRELLEVESIFQNPEIDIMLLYLEEEAIGLCELNKNRFPEIEMKYFGLLPEFIGQKLGSFFLDKILRLCWSYNPKRLWWHVVECDHHNAINTYERAGAHIYKQEIQ